MPLKLGMAQQTTPDKSKEPVKSLQSTGMHMQGLGIAAALLVIGGAIGSVGNESGFYLDPSWLSAAAFCVGAALMASYIWRAGDLRCLKCQHALPGKQPIAQAQQSDAEPNKPHRTTLHYRCARCKLMWDSGITDSAFP